MGLAAFGGSPPGRVASPLLPFAVRFLCLSLFLLLALGLAACMPDTFLLAQPPALPTLAAAANPPPRPTVAIPPTRDLSTATPAVLPANAPASTPTATPLPSPTAGPYAGLTIADLAARSYGGGQLEIVQTLGTMAAFTRYLVRYPSDGLTIYGFMNVPRGDGPFPVVVALHGYVDPAGYDTLDYTTSHADSLASNGYLVLHPNYRGYPPSEDGPNPFRIGFAIDVLNLVALVQQQGGQPGALAAARPGDIHLWGHSMGGGIALRVITVNPSIRSAVLYGAMSGDEYQNFERILAWSEGETGREELATPADAMLAIAPIHHLARIQAAISIHHGSADGIVPPAWSADLCDRLRLLGKSVECYAYPDQPHNFSGDGDALFRRRTLAFFNLQQSGGAAGP